MTLPTDIIFPLQTDLIKAGDSDSLELYLRNLIDSLTEMYRDMTDNINGSIRQFTPIIVGGTTAGVGTYTSQYGWYLRQGIMVDVWFDVTWTAHTGTGISYVQLPYKVLNSEGNPFAGTLATSGIAFTAGYSSTFGVAFPNTFQFNVIEYGSAVPFSNMNIAASGRYIGHARYIGQEFEN